MSTNIIEMNRVVFENDLDALDKLKEIGLLTKTKKVEDLSKIVYKTDDLNNNITSKPCKVLGYNWKESNKNCISNIYENLTIEVEGRVFDINIDYLKDMQKKSWGSQAQAVEE